MSEALVLVSLVVFGLIMLNGFAAGAVSILHFWRKSRDVNLRALVSAFTAGLVTAGTLSGAMLVEGFDEALPAMLGLLFIALISGLGSLPGAFIMSRKIVKSDRFDTDVFS